MPRPSAGDLPAIPPSPFAQSRSGVPAPVAPAPFSSTNQPNTPTPAGSATPTARGLFNAFRRRWVLGTFLGVLVAAIAVVVAWMTMPAGKHQARALVQLRPKGVEFVNRNQEDFAAYRRHQIFLLKTRDLITRTLADPAVASLNMVKQSDDPVQLIEDQLKVTVVADDILEVTLTGNHLDDMKVILDHLVKRYIDDATLFDRRQRDDEVKKLDRLAESLRLEIESEEKRIELRGIASSTTGGEDNARRLAELQAKYITADGEYNRVTRDIGRMESEVKVLRQQLEDKNPKAMPDPVLVNQAIRSDPRVVKALTAWNTEKDRYDRELKTAGGDETVPLIVELKAKVDKLFKEYEEAKKLATTEAIEVARAIETAQRQQRVARLETDIQIAREDRDGLKAERDAYKKLIDVGVGGGLNIEAMRKALQPQRDTLDKINSHLAQLRVQKELDARVTMRGSPEAIPNNNLNRKIALSAASGFVAIFGAILLVAFLEWRTRRVDGVEQVVGELGMRVIGTVPAFPSRANLRAAEASGANWRFVLNEAINSTRTMLLHTARSQSMQVVMVTSATQGEGKTSLASQLASSMATAGMRTLIVDCDLRNPSIQKLFELPLGPGVSEVLRQEVDVSEAVQATAVPNLWVITAGQCSHTTIAAIAQGHPLETLFNRLRGQFDFVIVDSCPVLPVADALLIGQHVDGVVFSIMQDISQLPKVMTASEKLHQLNIPLVGAVVNGIKQDTYSYGYNYVKQLPA
ncbi:MAG: polysaccharide biosynthesis tyrosine autokinase [Planctomycetia bacterium]|nr:polysaccharide biosynthesis tyrosine autokinase [Planctomycetia bacterium]